ncbi:hypothetical protein FGO68_gene13040 [Halteria grandinella]|uniref:Uncharacterized protein n=1 Tax=Halteria grandinella TaxID=5974 RepID=A0A8J8T320_HALGN|nr:hypothetical protein FGO68_gene13040 [Halteria grandinella]
MKRRRTFRTHCSKPTNSVTLVQFVIGSIYRSFFITQQFTASQIFFNLKSLQLVKQYNISAYFNDFKIFNQVARD